MPSNLIYSPNFLLSIIAAPVLVALMLCSAFLGRQLNKSTVIIIGLALIGIGVYGHINMLDLEANGKKLLEDNSLSPEVFEKFSRYRDIFVYFFPAISAAIGTSAISDALLKHQTYESNPQFESCGFLYLFRFIGFIIKSIGVVLWIVNLPIAYARRLFGATIPRIWRWTQLKALKALIVARYSVRKESRVSR